MKKNLDYTQGHTSVKNQGLSPWLILFCVVQEHLLYNDIDCSIDRPEARIYASYRTCAHSNYYQWLYCSLASTTCAWKMTVFSDDGASGFQWTKNMSSNRQTGKTAGKSLWGNCVYSMQERSQWRETVYCRILKCLHAVSHYQQIRVSCNPPIHHVHTRV